VFSEDAILHLFQKSFKIPNAGVIKSRKSKKDRQYSDQNKRTGNTMTKIKGQAIQ
jgi:hypothetical protein